jgi:hypothetical protein
VLSGCHCLGRSTELEKELRTLLMGGCVVRHDLHQSVKHHERFGKATGLSELDCATRHLAQFT